MMALWRSELHNRWGGLAQLTANQTLGQGVPVPVGTLSSGRTTVHDPTPTPSPTPQLYTVPVAVDTD